MKILVMSCDKNNDLWEPFYKLTEKYWPDHPEIFYLTEKLDNPYYKTIKKDYPLSSWSRRVRDAAAEIDDNTILVLCDDVFIYDTVNTEKLEKITSVIDENTGSVNLHHRFSIKEEYVNDLLQKRPKHAKYNCSVMCSVWNKENLLKVFDVDLDPWKFETTVNDLGLDYYVYNSVGDFLKFRESDKSFLFGLWRGKWSRHCIDLFAKEAIKIDFSIRGIYD